MNTLLVLGILLQQPADINARVTPTCELAGLVVQPPDGWTNIQRQQPPPGHAGCQMVLVDADGDPVGILRLRSVTGATPEFADKTEATLIATERASLSNMGVKVGATALWTRDPVPITGSFRDARGAGYPANVANSTFEQEVHILTFRDDQARYLLTLITATRKQAPNAWQRNTDDFGTVMRSFKKK